MKKDFYPSETICQLHSDLKKLYKSIMLKNSSAELEEMYRLSKSIHYKATRMEKRLMRYRKAIEYLGFERAKK